MVERFARVVEAHRVQKLLVENLFDRFRVARFERGVQVCQLVCFGFHFVVEARKHLLHVDLTHLAVRNPKLVSVAIWVIDRRQVAGHVQKAPDVLDARVDLVVRQLLV